MRSLRTSSWFERPIAAAWCHLLAPFIPERSEGLLFPRTLDFHRVYTTTEIPVQRRQNGPALRPMPPESALGNVFRHVLLTQIRG